MAQVYRMLTWPLVEYGFSYSGARAIAVAPDRASVRATTDGVASATVILSLGAVGLGVVAFRYAPLLHDEWGIVAWATLAAISTGSAPWWYYQGTQRLGSAARMSAGLRGCAVMAVFAFIREPHHVWLVVAIDAMASGTLTLWMWFGLAAEVGRPRFGTKLGVQELRSGGPLAQARIMERWYDAVPGACAGALLGAGAVGMYGGADKILKLWRTASNALTRGALPVAASDKEMARSPKLIPLTLLVGLTAAGFLALIASPITTILLGPGFEDAAVLVQLLAIGMPATLLTSVLVGMVALPRGMDRAVRTVTLVSLVLLGIGAVGGGMTYGVSGLVVAVAVADWSRAGGIFAVSQRD